MFSMVLLSFIVGRGELFTPRFCSGVKVGNAIFVFIYTKRPSFSLLIKYWYWGCPALLFLANAVCMILIILLLGSPPLKLERPVDGITTANGATICIIIS